MYGREPELKQNPNPPAVRFIRKNGRIIPIVQGKKKRSLIDNLEGRVNEMKREVNEAERGMRQVSYDRETDHHRNFATKSSYPEWYSKIKFKNKEDFKTALLSQRGKKHDEIINQAIDDLIGGYESPDVGRVPPDREFRIKTKQAWDNTNVIFRKIDGKVRPIKIRLKQDDFSDIPF